ncbi:MAG: rRNA pseudouridine synthase [Gemmatirosa sp.]|nr:rRNA pseudouridine synthase [Gemmatirosa sp.]
MPNDRDAARVSLARALSKLGVCSRAQGEAMVVEGRVRVDGVVRRDPSFRVDPGRAEIAVDGQAVRARRTVYLALNKPRGLVTTRDDPQGRETVYACLADRSLPFVSPVGRLDKASEGLLLFTNDTRWAARLLDPASHVDKVYHVQIDRVPDEALLTALTAGVDDASERLAAKAVRVLRHGERTAWLEVVLDEGRNRHIRRLLAALDVEVLRLVRVAIGPLALGTLAKGAWRHLTAAEMGALGR